MKGKAFQQKMKSLALFPGLNLGDVQRFESIVGELSGWELLRINPIRFADRHGFEHGSILDIFVHAAKVGLFDFEWNLICPMCGAIVYSYDLIGHIKTDPFFCSTCDIHVQTDLSDYIEVAFSIDPGVEKVEIDPFQSAENYFRYFVSANHHMPDAFTRHYQEKAWQAFQPIAPEETARLSFSANPNDLFRLVSIDNNSLLRLRFDEHHSDLPQIVEIDVLPDCFSLDTITLPAGPVTLYITNRLNRTCAVNLNRIDLPTMRGYLQAEPPRQDPFATGKKLLNNQSFRELFRIQDLPRDLKLKVSQITILFTDLKGSTELYEKTGDLFAYNLVQEHFEILKQSIRSHSGAIVKTIGDAIMASFSTPADGLSSALDMLEKIQVMNGRAGHEVAIKVGLNAGSAIVVTANETLDYFGQTVNVAARVQNLAQAGEVWITESVHGAEQVRELLESHGLRALPKSAHLRGVSQPMTVYHCSSDRAILA